MEDSGMRKEDDKAKFEPTKKTIIWAIKGPKRESNKIEPTIQTQLPKITAHWRAERVKSKKKISSLFGNKSFG